MTSQRRSARLQLRRSISEQLRDSTSKAWDLLWRNVRERRLAGQRAKWREGGWGREGVLISGVLDKWADSQLSSIMRSFNSDDKMNRNKFQSALMRIASLLLAAIKPNFLSLFRNEAALVGNAIAQHYEKFHMIRFVYVYTQPEASSRVMRKRPVGYFGGRSLSNIELMCCRQESSKASDASHSASAAPLWGAVDR